jgi:hypothetical protein
MSQGKTDRIDSVHKDTKHEDIDWLKWPNDAGVSQFPGWVGSSTDT